MIYDNGKNHNRDLQAGMEQWRKELGYLLYSSESTQSSSIRKLKWIVPGLDENGYKTC